MKKLSEYYLGHLKEANQRAKHELFRGTLSDFSYPTRKRAEEIPASAEPEIKPVDWFSHALLVAAQGSGKTNVFRWRIEQLTERLKAGTATLILLDPKDVLTRELPTLVRSLGLEDRTVLIDPLEAPVSFNLFDRGD